ncbi:hypothetical protein MIMGU_mgv1a019639mg [Erythranthe guttata]|uniref:VQ domain-containing protein n=1 Tax=Erythranthe guttata TaxID=4155 RepID=A0A022REL1_ERYGU|nr:hypothetical protein MIMGU_mgv1a019639mg [Erythranthe guttata]
MGGGGMMKRELLPVKVVIINTQYVETDAVSFKSVVQSLTGKDTAAAEKPKLKSRSSCASAFNYNINNAIERVLERGLGVSFKYFDRMLKELPSLDMNLLRFEPN